MKNKVWIGELKKTFEYHWHPNLYLKLKFELSRMMRLQNKTI